MLYIKIKINIKYNIYMKYYILGIVSIIIILIIYYYSDYIYNFKKNNIKRIKNVFNILKDKTKLYNIFKESEILSKNVPQLCKLPRTKLNGKEVTMNLVLSYDKKNEEENEKIKNEIKKILEKKTDVLVSDMTNSLENCENINIDKKLKENLENNTIMLTIELKIIQSESKEVSNIKYNINNLELKKQKLNDKLNNEQDALKQNTIKLELMNIDDNLIENEELKTYYEDKDNNFINNEIIKQNDEILKTNNNNNEILNEEVLKTETTIIPYSKSDGIASRHDLMDTDYLEDDNTEDLFKNENKDNEERIIKMNEIEEYSKDIIRNIKEINNKIDNNNDNKTNKRINEEIIEIKEIIIEINEIKQIWQNESLKYTKYKIETIEKGEINNYKNYKNIISEINNIINQLNINIIEKEKKIEDNENKQIILKMNEIEEYSKKMKEEIEKSINKIDKNNNKKTIERLQEEIINIKVIKIEIDEKKEKWDLESKKYDEYILKVIEKGEINNYKNYTNMILYINEKKEQINNNIKEKEDKIEIIKIIIKKAEEIIKQIDNIREIKINEKIIFEYNNIKINEIKEIINEKIRKNKETKDEINNLINFFIENDNKYYLENKYKEQQNKIKEIKEIIDNQIKNLEKEKGKINNTIKVINDIKTQYNEIQIKNKKKLSRYNKPIIYNILFKNREYDTNKIINDLQYILGIYNEIINKIEKIIKKNETEEIKNIIIEYYDKVKTEYTNKYNIYKKSIKNLLIETENELNREKEIIKDYDKIELIKSDQYCGAKEVKIGQGEKYKLANNIKKCYMDLKHNSECRYISDSFMINPETGDCYCYIFTDCDKVWDEKNAKVYKMKINETGEKMIEMAYKKMLEEEEKKRLEQIEKEKRLKQLREDRLRIYNEAKKYLLEIGDNNMIEKKYILATNDEYCSYEKEYKVGQAEKYMGKTGPEQCYIDLQKDDNCKYADAFLNNIKTGDCYCYINNYCNGYIFRMDIPPYNSKLFEEADYNIHLKEIFSEMFNLDIDDVIIYADNNLIQILLNKIPPKLSLTIIKEITDIINDNNKKKILLNKIRKGLPKTLKITVYPIKAMTRYGEEGALIFQINLNKQMKKWAKEEQIRLRKERENKAKLERLKKEKEKQLKEEAEEIYKKTRKKLLDTTYDFGNLIGIDTYCGGIDEQLIGNNIDRYTGNHAVLNCYNDLISECVEPIGFMTNIKTGDCYCYNKAYIDENKEIENEEFNNCIYKFSESGAFTYLLTNLDNINNEFI